MSSVPALFLDRDGVINVDVGYAYRSDQIVFVDGIFQLCSRACDQGYRIIIVTNQSGIGRGLYSEADFHTLMNWMKDQFARASARIDAVYYCPHHAEHGVGAYRRNCSCRKPEPGLLLDAQRDLSLDLSKSALVGDKMSDILSARRAQIGTRILFADNGPDLTGPHEVALSSIQKIRDYLFPPC